MDFDLNSAHADFGTPPAMLNHVKKLTSELFFLEGALRALLEKYENSIRKYHTNFSSSEILTLFYAKPCVHSCLSCISVHTLQPCITHGYPFKETV